MSGDDPGAESTSAATNERTAAARDDGDGRIRSGRLAGKSLSQAIWILAAPVLLQQILAAFVGFFDKLIGGHLPESIVVPALDGLGIGTYVGWLIGVAMIGLGVGGQAIIARAMGSGRVHEGDAALGQSVLLSIVWGAFIGVLLWWIAYPLSALADLSPEATRLCAEYVRMLALGLPFCAVMMVGGMCLHGAGESVKPTTIAIVVNIVNVLGSWLLSGVELRLGGTTIPNPSPLDPLVWGVAGIGAGTTIGYAVGAFMTIWVLARGVKDLRLHARDLAPKKHLSWRIARVGIPSFFEGMTMWSVGVVVTLFIGMISRRGGDTADAGLIGAHSIAIQWEAFSYLPGYAIGTAAASLAGQYLGARNPREARRAIRVCAWLGAIVMSAFGAVFALFGTELTRTISSQPVHLDLVPKCLLICAFAQPFFSLSMTVRQGLRGAGDTAWVFYITLVSTWGIRLPAAWFLGVHLDWGLPGIWIGLCGELVIRGLFFLARFTWGNWTRIEV
ncbi:MAG: MATE family efflux transporter [Phycisphaerae bacterium]|nr:MATE family efflux transporter [Phycisphaerae bacterium]